MVLEYSYDNAMKILGLMKNSMIATLDIQESKEHKGRYAMEYTLVKDYPEDKIRVIRDAMRNSLPERLRLIELFNNIIVTKSAGRDISFWIHFNAVAVKKCTISHYYDGGPLIRDSEEDLVKEMKLCLERCDSILTRLGASGIECGVYTRKGGGRNKKYTQLTLGELSHVIRKALEE